VGSWDGAVCPECGEKTAARAQPAELYGGTYTGLCQSCVSKGPYLDETRPAEPSGARWWSHPPHCPSWRRDRESFLYFEGADCCRFGRLNVPRADTRGGDYGKQCEKCRDRHERHPVVQETYKQEHLLRAAQLEWRKRMSAEYVARLYEHGFLPPVSEAVHADFAAGVFQDGPPEPTLALPRVGKFAKEWAHEGRNGAIMRGATKVPLPDPVRARAAAAQARLRHAAEEF
jgi:hypothetical protein